MSRINLVNQFAIAIVFLAGCRPINAPGNFYAIVGNILKANEVRQLNWEIHRTIGGYSFISRLVLSDHADLTNIIQNTSLGSFRIEGGAFDVESISQNRDGEMIHIARLPNDFSKLVPLCPWLDLKPDGRYVVRFQRNRNPFSSDGVHWWLFSSAKGSNSVIYVFGGGI